MNRYAAIALGWLAYDKSTRVLMVDSGAVPPLVSLLSSGTDNGKIAGAFALGWLANEPDARGKIVSSGAIDPLVKLVSSETGEGRTTAAGALGWLANEQPGRGMIVAAGAIDASAPDTTMLCLQPTLLLATLCSRPLASVTDRHCFHCLSPTKRTTLKHACLAI